MKLVEILARELKEWPEDSCCIVQNGDGDIKGMGSTHARLDKDVWQRDIPTDFYEEGFKISDDWSKSFVTHAQWEAERARILAESSKFTDQDKEHIAELTAIACGKISKEDQELWDKAYFRAWELGIEDGIKQSLTLEYLEVITTGAVHMADRFMEERAKRMKL